MKFHTIVFIIFLSIIRINATEQFPDLLIVGSDTLGLYQYPLESLLESDSIARNKFIYEFSSTACYRGYLAKWSIFNDSLYLIELHENCDLGEKSKLDLERIFGDKCINNRVFAYWVRDSIVSFKHPFKFNEKLEDEIEYVFVDGRMVRYKTYKTFYSKYDKDIYLLTHDIYTRINWDKIPNLGTKDLELKIKIVTNIPGKIDSVIIQNILKPDISNEIKRVILSLDDWTIQYHDRKLVRFWPIIVILNESARKKYKKVLSITPPKPQPLALQLRR